MKRRFNSKPLEAAINEIFIPTAAQAALFVSLATIMLFIIFFDQIFRQLVGNDPTARFYFEQTISDYLSSLSSVPFAEYLTNVLLWGLAGVAVYLVLLLAFNMLISLRNNVMIRSEENLPKLFDSFSLVDEYRRVIWIFAFGVFLVLSLTKFAAAWFNAFQIGIVDLDVFFILLGLLLASYNLYILYMLSWTAIRNPNILARN